MREAMLLILNCINIAYILFRKVVFKVYKELFYL
jgi:hypothetical protein